MRISRLLITSGALGLALVASIGLAPAASAQYDSNPIGPTGWVPDGPVFAVAVSGDRVFVGGGFTGGVAALDATSGALQWTGNANDTVRALAVSSDGSHVIAGGAFTAVDGATHRKLASLQAATGTAERTWRAGAGGLVRDVVIHGDVAYFGGTFRSHNGIQQRGLGAVSVTTGKAVTGFTATTDANVYALAKDSERLYFGGNFLTVNGSPRNSLAAVDLDTRALDAWNPPRACTGCNRYWDLLADGTSVYVATRNGGAATAFDRATGAMRWRVTANGDAQALAMADGLLYVGGHFVSIARQSRIILAALNPLTGAVDPDFQPRFVTTWPGIWALAATSTRLYVGGQFTGAGASPPRQYPYFAMFG